MRATLVLAALLLTGCTLLFPWAQDTYWAKDARGVPEDVLQAQFQQDRDSCLADARRPRWYAGLTNGRQWCTVGATGDTCATMNRFVACMQGQGYTLMKGTAPAATK
jgi:hypothetical protein